MKTEMFINDSLAVLQAMVNEFIYNKEVVNVSISTCGMYGCRYIACVLYRESVKKSS